MINKIIYIFLHLDVFVQSIVVHYSKASYLIIFLIIFIETGIVVMPFLPGDSLLFAAGALAARGTFQIEILYIVVVMAAITGDAVNYQIGKRIGPKIFSSESSRFLNKKHLLRTHDFYERYGQKTIIFARFVPIVRTFAPFVAGIGSMSYRSFLLYNFIGGVIWCSLFVWGGYWFGNIEWVKENFGILVIAIILLSVIPFFFEIYRSIFKPKTA